MKFWRVAILTAGISIAASAQPGTASLPISLERVYQVIGLEGVKPQSRGPLTFSSDAIQFAGGKASVTVPTAAVTRYSLNPYSREVAPGFSRSLLQTATLVFSPLVEGGVIASGIGLGMVRTGVAALEFDYLDSSNGLHRVVFLLPRTADDSARQAMASLHVPVEAAAPAPHPTFPRNANLLTGRAILSKGAESIRVTDVAAGESGMPAFFEALIYEQLISRLNASGYFRHVLRAGEDAPSGAAGKLFSLQTGITGFMEGKPRLRFATLGFGKGRITAEVRLSAASNTLLRDNIVNVTAVDGQSSLDACRLLAANVVQLVTKKK
jgi:hypothetical protein